MNFCYRFPVVRGIQAGKIYYIAMVPLKMLGHLFASDEEYVLPEYRAQRRLNEARIPEIKKYILENIESYVFSALAASIDGEFNFIEQDNNGTGILEVSLDARFLINDGQHRKAAIMAALEENSSLENETISVVFYEDQGLARSQQMFTDLNKHALKTSNSLAELYDSRDRLAVATRKVIAEIAFLDTYVDKEKDNLGKYSASLFTLNIFYTANKKILRRKECDENFERFLQEFWSLVVEYMIPWKEMESKELSKKELFVSGREEDFLTVAELFEAVLRQPDASFDMKREAICALCHIHRVSGNADRLFSLAFKLMPDALCAELCCEIGSYFQAREDYQEAIQWFELAAHGAEAVIDVRRGGTVPLAALKVCYCKLAQQMQDGGDLDEEAVRFYLEQSERYGQEAEDWTIPES